MISPNLAQIKLPLVFVLLAFLSGCAGIERAMTNPDPTHPARYIQQNNLTHSQVEPQYQLRICEAYLLMKEFSRFNECLASYQQRVPGPRIKLYTPNPFGKTFHWMNEDYSSAYIYGMKAEAALDLANYQQAYDYGQKAFKAAKGSPTIDGVSYSSDEQIINIFQSGLLPRITGVMTISSIRLGKEQEADFYLKELQNIDVDSLGTTGMAAWKKPWLARSYLTAGDSQRAYETLTGVSLSGAKVFTETMIYVNYLNPAYYAAKVVTEFDVGDAISIGELEENAMICRSLYGMSKLDEAKQCYGDIYGYIGLPSFGNVHFAVLNDLGAINAELHDFNEAEKYFKKAIELLETQRSSISLDGQKMGFVEDRLAVYGKMVATQLALGKPDVAFEYVERSKSRALVDLLASKKQFGSQASSQQKNLLSQLDNAANDAFAAQPLEGTRNVRGLKRKVQAQAPKLSSVTTVSARSFKELQSLIPEGETLIEYYQTQDQWHAFIVTSNSIKTVALPAKNLAEPINEFRKKILQPKSGNYKSQANALYQAVFEPVKPHLTTSNITIVAHGELHYLPFNALFDGRRYVIDRYSLRLLPSTSVLDLIPNNPMNKSQSTLVLGNPDLGNRQYDLPAAEQEARQLGRVVKGAEVLIQKKATETAIKQKGAEFNRLHIASHGEFDQVNPLNSRLLLSADSANDGVLTVSDIYNLDLKANLVTLSACETGLGDIKTGDDVVGLNRGFLYAGASSVVSTLWVVDDKATENLMVSFYKKLERSNKREALRSAQLKIKNNYNSHPFYWAAFQLTGLD